VCRDAYGDVCLPQRFEVGQRAGRQLAVADRTFVLLGDLLLLLLLLLLLPL